MLPVTGYVTGTGVGGGGGYFFESVFFVILHVTCMLMCYFQVCVLPVSGYVSGTGWGGYFLISVLHDAACYLFVHVLLLSLSVTWWPK